jgi:MFS superfamily sulfate permease-like transporter
LVVFLVALPLSMGIALASSVPPALGLVTAVIGGLVIGTFGGAHLQVSGPSAGLAVLIAELVGEHGMATFALIVIIAGLLQIASGLAKHERLFQAVSPAVVRAMLTGIGMLIIEGQFYVRIDDRIEGGGLDKLLAMPLGVVRAFTNTTDTLHMGLH